MSPKLFAIILLGVTLLGTSASAQLVKVGEITLAASDSARGVSFEYPFAYVSLYGNGMQYKVDVTNPAAPFLLATFNPAFGNQRGENVAAFNRVVSAHELGGLNLWDVTGAPFQLASAGTNDHWDGLEFQPVGPQQLVLYSEHNAGGNPGGLRVYDISANTLNNIGNSLAGGNARDGRFLTMTQDRWVYQLDGGFGSPRPLMLNVYDLTVPSAPVFVTQFNMGNTVGAYAGLTDLLLDPTQNYLYAACGLDGLRVVDITVRSAPVVVNTLSAPNAVVKELTTLRGTTFVGVSVRFPNGQWRFRPLNCVNPVFPVQTGTWMGDPNYVIHDISAQGHATGPIVLVAGQNAAGAATLQVWQ
jgi:hypothetical protein